MNPVYKLEKRKSNRSRSTATSEFAEPGCASSGRKRWVKEGEGHYPLAPKDPKAVVDFIVKDTRGSSTGAVQAKPTTIPVKGDAPTSLYGGGAASKDDCVKKQAGDRGDSVRKSGTASWATYGNGASRARRRGRWLLSSIAYTPF